MPDDLISSLPTPPTETQRRQERANSISHGIMAILAMMALAPLIVLAALKGNARHIVGFSIFGSALVFLFVASTLMHWKYMRGRAKRVYDFLDYAGIYLVIAGTYTPFCLVTLHGAWGWSLFGVAWGLAVTGTLLSLFLGARSDRFANLIYLLMGWLIVIAIKPLARNLAPGGLALLLGGGLAYSVGVVVMSTQRLVYRHAYWHLFVGLGALLHTLALVLYVLPDMH